MVFSFENYTYCVVGGCLGEYLCWRAVCGSFCCPFTMWSLGIALSFCWQASFPAEPFYEPGFLSSLVLFIYNTDFSKHAEWGQEGSLLVEHLPGGHKDLVWSSVTHKLVQWLCLFSVAVIKPWSKAACGGMSLFGLYILGHSALTETNTRNSGRTRTWSETGTEAEPMEEHHYWLGSHILFSLLYIAQVGTLEWYHPQWLPPSVINQENVPQTYLQASVIEGIP